MTKRTPFEAALSSRSVDRFAPLIGPDRMLELGAALEEMRELLDGRVFWDVNSTATGGGVAEMIRGLVPYLTGAGIAARWLVIEADPQFFLITKRLHHALHGSEGDGSVLGSEQRRHYEEILAANAAEMSALIRPGDPVMVHDPQTAGLVPVLKSRGAIVIWRCHIGTESPNQECPAGWNFLDRYLEDADALVFTRRQYVPESLSAELVSIIPPSIDPFVAKNADMTAESVRGILAHTGIIEGPDGHPTFRRDDGSRGRVDRQADIVRLGRAPAWDAPLVVQSCRWDSLKDHAGVMRAFVELMSQTETDSHLILAGPNVHGVADDPEQAAVLDDLIGTWRTLTHKARGRIHLVCVPTADAQENAAIVNALQRHAAVVVQKSIAEGFGLTVTEALWKSRPVVASALGGLVDQIEDGVNGLLLDDPNDASLCADRLARVLADHHLAGRLGRAGHQRALGRFLVVNQLTQYRELLRRLA